VNPCPVCGMELVPLSLQRSGECLYRCPRESDEIDHANPRGRLYPRRLLGARHASVMHWREADAQRFPQLAVVPLPEISPDGHWLAYALSISGQRPLWTASVMLNGHAVASCSARDRAAAAEGAYHIASLTGVIEPVYETCEVTEDAGEAD
jgi:hypothetical protein